MKTASSSSASLCSCITSFSTFIRAAICRVVPTSHHTPVGASGKMMHIKVCAWRVDGASLGGWAKSDLLVAREEINRLGQ